MRRWIASARGHLTLEQLGRQHLLGQRVDALEVACVPPETTSPTRNIRSRPRLTSSQSHHGPPLAVGVALDLRGGQRALLGELGPEPARASRRSPTARRRRRSRSSGGSRPCATGTAASRRAGTSAASCAQYSRYGRLAGEGQLVERGPCRRRPGARRAAGSGCARTRSPSRAAARRGARERR